MNHVSTWSCQQLGTWQLLIQLLPIPNRPLQTTQVLQFKVQRLLVVHRKGPTFHDFVFEVEEFMNLRLCNERRFTHGLGHTKWD
jgi:hypothetical protein